MLRVRSRLHRRVRFAVPFKLGWPDDDAAPELDRAKFLGIDQPLDCQRRTADVLGDLVDGQAVLGKSLGHGIGFPWETPTA